MKKIIISIIFVIITIIILSFLRNKKNTTTNKTLTDISVKNKDITKKMRFFKKTHFKEKNTNSKIYQKKKNRFINNFLADYKKIKKNYMKTTKKSSNHIIIKCKNWQGQNIPCPRK